MRHGDKINNLSRTASHRKALLMNLTCQLFEHKKIVTTLAKAKALRTYAEPLITKAKENTTHQRRIVFSRVGNKETVKELFDAISPKIGDRPGGYTRIIKLGKRLGDNAELALIELVDFNDVYTKGTEEKKATGRRTRRSGRGKKSTGETKPTEAQEQVTAEVATGVEEAPEAQVASAEEVKAEETEAAAAEESATEDDDTTSEEEDKKAE